LAGLSGFSGDNPALLYNFSQKKNSLIILRKTSTQKFSQFICKFAEIKDSDIQGQISNSKK
jgi:hypothetical protein